MYLDAVARPEDLLRLGRAGEHDRLVERGLGGVLQFALGVQLPQRYVVKEGDVVGRVPVQAVAVLRKHCNFPNSI